MGNRVSPEVFSTRNMICALEAVFLSGLVSCISCMAFNPIGVAALSRLSMFAAIFIIIDPCAGCDLPSSGKSLLKNGPMSLEKTATMPPFSPIFMIPIQRVKTPVNPNEISKPDLAMSNVALIIAGKTSTSPRKSRRTKPIMKADKKKNIQI